MLNGLVSGETLTRRQIHQRFGGREQGGISPSRRAPVVMFFTDPETGHQHGYYDGWGDDGYFHYVGEGQVGDQRMVQGNRAIRDAREEGRSIEGFRAKGSRVTYLGEFELVDFYYADAHESGSDQLRQVIVYRLRPLTDVPEGLPGTPITPSGQPVVDRVPVEERNTERGFVTPDREPYEWERKESDLVHKYRSHLLRQGHDVDRLRIVPPGESSPLFCDLWDETDRSLIEAKSSVARPRMREAVGQLLDYGRFVAHARRTVLVPVKPRPDVLAFLTSVDVGVVFPSGDEWLRLP
jgi:hypothetical protein